MPTFNSFQHQKRLDNKLANKPEGGGDLEMLRFEFKAPAGGLAIADKIIFGIVPFGYRFNPADCRIHWSVGTATADLDLGHPGYSNIDDQGVISDIAADPNEFLAADDLGGANLGGTSLLNARVGGVKPSRKNAAGAFLTDGILIEGVIATAGVPVNQVIVLEIVAWKA